MPHVLVVDLSMSPSVALAMVQICWVRFICLGILIIFSDMGVIDEIIALCFQKSWPGATHATICDIAIYYFCDVFVDIVVANRIAKAMLRLLLEVFLIAIANRNLY